MTTHRDPHLCPDCGLCSCGCDQCGRIACACLDCPCQEPSDHTETPCDHLKGKAPAAWANIVAMYDRMSRRPTLRPIDPAAWMETRQPQDIEAALQADRALAEYLQRQLYKNAPALNPRIPKPPVSTYWHTPRWTERVHWSPRAYAALRGLKGTAADMFTGMIEELQRQDTRD